MTRCTIYGIEYDEVPVDGKGEYAFAPDGGPNPEFDWKRFRKAMRAAK